MLPLALHGIKSALSLGALRAMRPRHAVLPTPSVSLCLPRNPHGIISFTNPHSLILLKSYRFKNCAGWLHARRSNPFPPTYLPFHLFADPHPLTPVLSIFYKDMVGEGHSRRSASPKSFPCHRSEKTPVSPAIATDPKTHLSKSCICHTSDTPPGVTLASPTPGLPHPQAFQRFLQLSPIPFLFKLSRTLLSFFALTKTSTRLFSIASTLFAKNTGGGLRSSFRKLGFVHFIHAGLRDGIRPNRHPQ